MTHKPDPMRTDDHLTPEQIRLLQLLKRSHAGEPLNPRELADLYPLSAESIRLAFPDAFDSFPRTKSHGELHRKSR